MYKVSKRRGGKGKIKKSKYTVSIFKENHIGNLIIHGQIST